MFGTELFFGPLVATLLIGIPTTFLLYWFSTRNHDYWQKRGIPFVKPLPFIGNIFEIIRKPFHEVEIRRYKKFGALYGHYEGNRPVLSVADPTLLRDILVKDFQVFSNRRDFSTGNDIVDKMVSSVRGEDWKRIRTIITPTFTTGKIKRMLTIFDDCAKTVVQNFKISTENGKPVDAKRVYGGFTMDVIASSAFSTKIDSHNNPDNEFVTAARKAFSRGLSPGFLLLLVAPRVVKWFKIPVFAPEAMEFFKKVTYQIIEERKKTGKGRNDFLQLLMDTATEVATEQKWDSAENEKADIASNYGQEDINPQIFKNVTSKHLSMNELVAQCVIFFIAGYDTTASTLSFVTYNLALNPDIQDKLRAEVDEALRKTNGEFTYDAIQNMKYLDNVISETLRIFPPAIRLEREAEAEYKLGDTGITIPKGMIVTMPVYAFHRDPEHYPEPEVFNPDRFTAEERSKRDQYAYLPFGAGPRNCIGMRFALMEIKTCLARVISNFIIKRSKHTKVPLEFGMGQQGILQPKEILIEMELRNNRPWTK